MASSVGQGSSLSEPRQPGVHQPRVGSETVLWSQSQFLHDSWSVGLYEDVCSTAQLLHYLHACLVLQVDCYGALVSRVEEVNGLCGMEVKARLCNLANVSMTAAD